MVPDARRAVYQKIFSYTPPKDTEEAIETFLNETGCNKIHFPISATYELDPDIHTMNQFRYPKNYPDGIDLKTHVLHDAWTHEWIVSDAFNDNTGMDETLYSFWSAIPLVFATYENPGTIIRLPAYKIEEIVFFPPEYDDKPFRIYFLFINEDALYTSIIVNLFIFKKESYSKIKTKIKCKKDTNDPSHDVEFIQIHEKYAKGIKLEVTESITYEVIGGVIVRSDKSTKSKEVGKLDIGTRVEVIQIDGNRVQIIYPIQGWCSIIASDGTVLLSLVDDTEESIS